MKAWEWAVWIALCLVPLAVAAASLRSLPDTVAMHVGPDGTIDRYGSKYELLPIACLLALPNLLLMLASWKAVSYTHLDVYKRQALYLMVFSLPLITVFRAGAFTAENVASIASYMSVLAFALPVYGVNTYLQKIFSSLRKMGVFAAFNFVAGAAQVALTMFGASHAESFPSEIIAVGEVLFYVVADVCLFAYLRRRLGPFGLRSTAKAFLVALVFGGLGAAAGGGVLFALTTLVGPLSGSIPQALAYVACGGLVSLAVTFGLAIKLRVPEAAFVGNIVGKVAGKLGRGRA